MLQNARAAIRKSQSRLQSQNKETVSLSRENETVSGQNRKDIRPGLRVDIVMKQDQRSGKRTRGVVKDILTSSPHHSRGIKVRLESGAVGRVQEIVNAVS
jgi:uncharacterized repeat protein (TIGR03833 family)